MSAGRFGPLLRPTASTFRLWAPGAREVSVVSDRAHTMAKIVAAGSLHDVPEAGPVHVISFRIDDELNVPDPASSFQPDDVSGPSELDRPLSIPVGGNRLARAALARRR